MPSGHESGLAGRGDASRRDAMTRSPRGATRPACVSARECHLRKAFIEPITAGWPAKVPMTYATRAACAHAPAPPGSDPHADAVPALFQPHADPVPGPVLTLSRPHFDSIPSPFRLHPDPDTYSDAIPTRFRRDSDAILTRFRRDSDAIPTGFRLLPTHRLMHAFIRSR